MTSRFFQATGRLLLVVAMLMPVSGGIRAAVADIGLSEAEKRWLAEHRKIRLAVDIDWRPFEYIDADGNYSGMAAEYIRLVGEKLGIEFDVEKEKPWSEVVEMMKNRELDMFSCVVDTEQRREYVAFTRPYLSFPMVIVTSDKVAYVNGIRDLRGETVAVVRGYATQDLLERNHPELDLYLASNVADALEKVSHGQVYAYIGNIATVSHVIRREGLTNIKISGETPYNYELSMAVRKDWPELVPILQKAIDSISDEQRERIFRDWIHLRYELGFDYALFWKVLAAVALVLAIILYWNRRLSAEVARRIEAEQDLQAVHRSLERANRQLLEHVDIVDRYVNISTMDRDGIITSASSAMCQACGYSEEELVGQHVGILRHEDIPDSTYREVWRKIRQGKTWRGELINRTKNGDYLWVFAYVSPILDENGDICGYTQIRQNITDRKRAEALSITDELTTLYNRRHFNNQFPQELARAERDKRYIGLLIIDIDHFKQYNDNYGHQRGDEALRSVALALKGGLRRAGDFAFRLGGEEFAVVVTADDSDAIREVAEDLRRAVADLGLAHEFSPAADHVSVSIGVRINRGRGEPPADAEVIYRRADDALYKAKHAGRNRVVATGDRADKRPANKADRRRVGT